MGGLPDAFAKGDESLTLSARESRDLRALAIVGLARSRGSAGQEVGGDQRRERPEPPCERLAELAFALTQLRLDPAENVALLAPLLDVPPDESRPPQLEPEELKRRQFAAVSAWVLAGARSQPIVLAVEDLHWADHPTRMSDLMAVADAGAIMSPKSTWFEPKPADGMVSHVPD
jgi:hypothetical protein